MGYRKSRCNTLCDYFVWFCRLWGIITAIGLWGVGVETTYHGHSLGAYLLLIAVIMSFLETVYFINFCVIICVRDDQKSFIRLWQAVLWIDNWKKGFLYLLLGAVCFARPHQVWMAIISGVMMLISATFYTLKTVKYRRDRIAEERAKAQQTYDTYDRFEVPDDLDDVMVDSLPYGHNDSVAEQDEILQV